ncbi:MAG: hypothetical protein J6J87_08120 [Oscillospiraceae bacterium]|nr:hypothetical protein [Oscillospiraceae bacterium]
MSFSLAPVVGEELDLVLVMNSFNGWHLLIHREGERFYAVYIPFRWFKSLQTDGLYLGSGGAATSYYYRLHFSNGTFTEELLANTDWGEQNEDGSYSGYYAIGGTEVTQAEFDAWLEDVFFTEDAVWRPVRAKSLEPWQEAYIEFLQPENRKSRTAAREAERDYSSVEEYYGLYDVDGDKIPELAICFWEFGRYYIDLYAYSDHEIRFLDSFCAGRNGPYIFICPGEAAFLTELVLYGPGGTSYGWRKFTLLDNVFKQEDLIECEIIPWDDADEPSPAGVPTKASDLVPNAQPLELIDIENIQKILLYVEGEEGSR